jgi:hypothetical protein
MITSTRQSSRRASSGMTTSSSTTATAGTALRTAGCTAPTGVQSAVMGLNRDPQPGGRPHQPVLDDSHARTHPPALASAAATTPGELNRPGVSGGAHRARSGAGGVVRARRTARAGCCRGRGTLRQRRRGWSSRVRPGCRRRRLRRSGGEQARVDAWTHRFRHRFSHTWLDRGGSEWDLMELNG